MSENETGDRSFQGEAPTWLDNHNLNYLNRIRSGKSSPPEQRPSRQLIETHRSVEPLPEPVRFPDGWRTRSERRPYTQEQDQLILSAAKLLPELADKDLLYQLIETDATAVKFINQIDKDAPLKDLLRLKETRNNDRCPTIEVFRSIKRLYTPSDGQTRLENHERELLRNNPAVQDFLNAIP